VQHKRRIAQVLPTLLTVLSLAACTGDSTPSAGPPRDASPVASGEFSRDAAFEVKRVWGTYTDAALAGDGDTAASQLSKETQALYAQFRDDALTLPADALLGRPPIDQLTIMAMRAKFDPDELRSLSNERVLPRVFELGLVDESTYITTDIVEVTAKGQTAVADVVQDGTRINSAYLFREEGEAWKLDLAEALDRGNAGFVTLARERGMTVPELVDRLVEIQYGVTAASDLRKPLDE
jgi:hypothetical protein